MFDFFQPVIDVFNFIYSILDTIIKGITGCVGIVVSLVDIVVEIARIIPEPLYTVFMIFFDLYIVIATYKLFRKG